MLSIESHVSYAVKITGAVTCLILVSRVLDTYSVSAPDSARHAKKLLQQSVKWHTLSKQDTHVFFAYQHANYASAYLSAARAMLPDAALEQSSGADIFTLTQDIDRQQTDLFAKISKQCARLKLGKKTTGTTSWLSD